jgi:hypothetical protein
MKDGCSLFPLLILFDFVLVFFFLAFLVFRLSIAMCFGTSAAALL